MGLLMGIITMITCYKENLRRQDYQYNVVMNSHRVIYLHSLHESTNRMSWNVVLAFPLYKYFKSFSDKYIAIRQKYDANFGCFNFLQFYLM